MRDWFGAIAAKFAEDRVPGVPGVPGVPSLREPQNPAVSDTRELEHAETHPVFQVFRTVSRPGSTNASTLIREHREHRPALKGVPAESLERSQETAYLPRPEHLEHPEHRFSVLARCWDDPEERAAIMQYDGGLTREEVEASVWPATGWQRLYRTRLTFWTLPRYDPYGVATRHLHPHRLAWSDLQNLWHKHHRVRVPTGLCAGCGEPIGDAKALTLNGYQTHIGRDPDCLTLHGAKWRTAADTALSEYGLSPPEDRP